MMGTPPPELDCTLLLVVDDSHLSELCTVFPTWLVFHPELAELPVVLLYDVQEVEANDTRFSWLRCVHRDFGGSGQFKFVQWPDDKEYDFKDHREKMLRAYIEGARYVDTEWFFKLDTDAVATGGRGFPLFDLAWFAGDPVLVSLPMRIMIGELQWYEQWAAGVPELSSYGPVDLADTAWRIISWFMLCRVGWAREVAALMTPRLPRATQDGVHAYLAKKTGKSIYRIPDMGRREWRHVCTRGTRSPLLDRCEAILRKEGYVQYIMPDAPGARREHPVVAAPARSAGATAAKAGPAGPTLRETKGPIVPPGASICLVGNGPSVRETKAGQWIDSHDVVIRFNEFVVKGFEEYVGSKTTIWSTLGKGKLPAEKPYPKSVVYLHGTRTGPAYDPEEALYRVPLEFYNQVRGCLHKSGASPGVIPSSGLLLLTWLLEHEMVPVVSIAGIDHFSKGKSSKHHYWVDRGYTQPAEHSPLLEELFVQEWRACGRIMEYPGETWKAPDCVAQARTRKDLSGLYHGAGVELGVAAGDYSKQILENPAVVVLYSVDRWSDHHDEAEYRAVLARLSGYGARSKVVRATFDEAEPAFADGTLDFVYIDGYAHTGQEGGRTLDQWWPKLREGGIFAGHDYHPAWPLTMQSVDSFVSRHGLIKYVTEDDQYPSWVVRKPGVGGGTG